MRKILGTTYISEKEASYRYGYSPQWFQRKRWEKKGPKFVKLEGKGKVLYPIVETDNWFKENIY